MLTLALVRRRGGKHRTGKRASMPRYASNGCFTLETAVLLTRFRAAANPLRIPKVIRKDGKSRIEQCAENTVIYYFIDGFAGYPGWLP